MCMVGERSVSLRRWGVNPAGGIGSANADMSSVKGVKSSLAESPRFPAPRSSAQGESAPKARQKCVVDGKQVNIPVPIPDAMWGRRRLGAPGVGCPGSNV